MTAETGASPAGERRVYDAENSCYVLLPSVK